MVAEPDRSCLPPTALSAQQPSPLLNGYAASWCAGLVHAIGNANFLFERSQTPHCTIKMIQDCFGVSSSVVYAHSKKVRELLTRPTTCAAGSPGSPSQQHGEKI